MLGAEPGTGKSTLFARWALSSALGIDFGDGQPEKPVGVILITAEEDARDYGDRFMALLEHHRISSDSHHRRMSENLTIWDRSQVLSNWPGTVRHDPQGPDGGPCAVDLVVAAVGALIREDTRLVLLDSLAALRISEDNETLAKFGYLMDKLAAVKGVGIMIAHHYRKPPPGQKSTGDMNNLRGGSSLLGAARVIVTLQKQRDDLGSVKIIRSNEKVSYGVPPDEDELQFFSVSMPDRTDSAPVLIGYEPPAMDMRWSNDAIREALNEALRLPDGERLKGENTPRWFGNAVAKYLPDSPDIGAEQKNQSCRNAAQKKNRRHVQIVLDRAAEEGLLAVDEVKSDNRTDGKGKERKVYVRGGKL